MRFADFARLNGLLLDHPLDDGRVHRCATESHPRSRNGAYKLAGPWGWVQDWAAHESPVIWFGEDATPEARAAARRDMQAAAREEARKRQEAARKAADIIQKCSTGPHPYLERKGFPLEAGLLDFDGRLVIPMRAVGNYRKVNSLQWIAADGAKKFMPGGAAGGSVFMLGNAGREHWLCEGYATALSVRAGLRAMHRPANVVVCFSAWNMRTVAQALAGPRFIVADNDENGVSARVATETGLPWAMPPTVGHDANDMHQEAGIWPLVAFLRGICTGNP